MRRRGESRQHPPDAAGEEEKEPVFAPILNIPPEIYRSRDALFEPEVEYVPCA